VPLFVDVWKSLGAAPTPMAFSEVFTSLQNGVIGAQENPLALIRSANFNEVQSHVNLTEHVRSWIYLTIAESTWAKLPEADQAAVMESAAVAQEFERGLLLDSLAEDQAYLEENGMTFVEVDGAAFQAAAKEAVLNNVSPEIKPIVESLFSGK
jgi:TRAP-type C4-dicarboxylate transport system substrate-binding protein